jgi:GalNAc-alpha-(1->4)-GalNAc-alpha-(1->3)-diNAcBac-PP-undecaprenol alpha-1,4-N-acetyl-D-galactosaminyltransferase
MKKQVLFIDCLASGGAQRQICYLANAYAIRGFLVDLVIYESNCFYEYLLLPNVTIVRLNNSNYIYRVISFVKYVKLTRPSSVISYLDTPNLINVFASFFVNYKTVVSERNVYKRIDFRRFILLNFYKFATHIVSNTVTQKEVLSNFYSGDFNILYIPNYLPQPEEIERKALRSFKYLILARYEPQKNLGILLEAISILRAKGIECFEIHIFGNLFLHRRVDNFSYFDSFYEKLLLFNVKNIFIHDETNSESLDYRNYDFFILPSFHEGLSNFMIESLSRGLPGIVSDVSDNSKFISNKVNGFVFEANDHHGLANCIENSSSISDEDYVFFSKNSIKAVEKLFDEQIFFNSYSILT